MVHECAVVECGRAPRELCASCVKPKCSLPTTQLLLPFASHSSLRVVQPSPHLGCPPCVSHIRSPGAATHHGTLREVLATGLGMAVELCGCREHGSFRSPDTVRGRQCNCGYLQCSRTRTCVPHAPNRGISVL